MCKAATVVAVAAAAVVEEAVVTVAVEVEVEATAAATTTGTVAATTIAGNAVLSSSAVCCICPAFTSARLYRDSNDRSRLFSPRRP